MGRESISPGLLAQGLLTHGLPVKNRLIQGLLAQDLLIYGLPALKPPAKDRITKTNQQ
jgi:hypothetical protein